MRTKGHIVAVLALTLGGTACATKRFVTKTVAPVEQRVTSAEAKNVEQDQKIATQAGHIEAVDRDLSRTKEQLTETDLKATAAGSAARQAGETATLADGRAQTAQQTADSAKAEAKQGIDRLGREVEAMNKFKMIKSGVVLFATGEKTLGPDAKAALDDFASAANGQTRFVIEVQGFADKTGGAAFNEVLSQSRAQSVARYLANEHMIPLRNIAVLGTGVAPGVQNTRDERKQSRKVDFRMWLPEVATVTSARN